jgi:hypothetical protein
VEPRIQKTLQSSIGPCPLIPHHKKTIGSHQNLTVDLVEIAKVATVYFIPLWTVGASHKLVHCRECGYTAKPEVYEQHRLLTSEGRSILLHPFDDHAWGQMDDFERLTSRLCGTCGGSLKDGWTFCPRCGSHT